VVSLEFLEKDHSKIWPRPGQTVAQFLGQGSKPQFPISTLSLRRNICEPPSRFKLRSQWGCLGVIPVRFARSAHLVRLFPASNLASAETSPPCMTSERSIRRLSWFVTRSAAAAPRSFSLKDTAIGVLALSVGALVVVALVGLRILIVACLDTPGLLKWADL